MRLIAPTERRGLPAAMLVLLLALMLASLLAAAACASNPNVNVESDEYFRPAAPETAAVAPEPATETDEQGDQTAADDEPDASEQPEQDAPAEQSDEADAAAQEDEETTPAPAPQADDVVRRFRSPVYGYSFELVCPPFCDPTSNGVDEVGFGSTTQRALVAVSVHEPPAAADGDAAEVLLRRAGQIPDAVDVSAGREAYDAAGFPGALFDWEDDRRATGGLLVRWRALVVPVGGLYYVIRGGAVSEDWDAVADALDRVVRTFTAPPEALAQPGLYNRFGFEIAYDVADRLQEYGQPTSNPATDAAGAFVLADESAVFAVLAWEEVGQAFFDAERAIERTLSDLLGIELGTGARDADEVDGQAAQTTITLTQIGADQVQVASWAWYCPAVGREFALHVLDEDDPRGVAADLIASFRCDAGGGG